MSKPTECIICRSLKRNQITCEYCPFQACASCCEQYLLSRSTPTCMDLECKREWTRKFMANQFSKVFMAKKYKCHKENIIAEQQMALMPATQVEVVRIQQMELKQTEIRQLNELIDQLIITRREKENEFYALRHRQTSALPKERHEFVRHCPVENCKGFLSSKWKCGICHIWCCASCHEIKGAEHNAEHTCDPVVVESIREIGSTSKQCPKCYVPIFKIEGCDQMWCTLCEVYFSWRTGDIDTSGRYHNPHALEALRRRNREGVPREPGDIICGRELTIQTVVSIERKLRNIYYGNSENSIYNQDNMVNFAKYVKIISTYVRRTIHIREVEMISYRINIEEHNLNLRVDYMMNRIHPDEFKQKLQAVHKKYSKYNEIYQVFEMMVVSNTDIIYRFVEHLGTINRSADISYAIFDEIKPVADYANECFLEIQNTYGCVVPKITNDLRVSKYQVVAVKKNSNSVVGGGSGETVSILGGGSQCAEPQNGQSDCITF